MAQWFLQLERCSKCLFRCNGLCRPNRPIAWADNNTKEEPPKEDKSTRYPDGIKTYSGPEAGR